MSPFRSLQGGVRGGARELERRVEVGDVPARRGVRQEARPRPALSYRRGLLQAAQVDLEEDLQEEEGEP